MVELRDCHGCTLLLLLPVEGQDMFLCMSLYYNSLYTPGSYFPALHQVDLAHERDERKNNTLGSR